MDNHVLYETADADQLDQEELANVEANATATLVALRTLLANKNFQVVLDEIIRPRLRSSLAKLKASGDAVELFKEQGAVRELEFILEGLPSTLEALRNTTHHGSKQTTEPGTPTPASSRPGTGRGGRKRAR